MNKTIQASLLIALSGILYGFLGYLGTSVLRENVSLSSMLFWRFFIAGMWMVIFVLRKQLRTGLSRTITKNHLLFTFVLSAIGYVGSSGFYFLASAHTGTGIAMVIFFSYPIIIALVSWLMYPQHFSMSTLLMLITMMIGLYLLRGSSTHELSLIGIMWGFLAAASYAFYVMGSKYLSAARMDSNVLTTIVCFSCSVVFLPMCFIHQSFDYPHTLKAWTYILALGILATALPIQFMLEGLRYVSSMRASIISVLEPLVTLMVGMILLGESVSHLQLLGAGIILASALFVQFIKDSQ